MSAVTVYSMGVVCCSVCAPADMDGDAVAAEVNRAHPSGTESGWSVSQDETFRTGQPNPCACEADPSRRHWLMDC